MEFSYLNRLLNDQREEFLGKMPGIPREVPWGDLLSPGRILVITGIRRSGKSTLLRQIAESLNGNFVYMNFDDIRFSAFTEKDYDQLFSVFAGAGKDCIYLFDEIQAAPVWERFLRRMHDIGTQLVVTGSNSSLLTSELGSHLTGRYLKQELFPFSFREYLTYRRLKPTAQTTGDAGLLMNETRRFIEIGGFPEYIHYERRELLEQIFKDILFRDIIARFGIQEKKGIQELALYLVSNPGAKISYGKLASSIGFKSSTSVKEYLGHMEDAYLLFQLHKFDWSLKRSLLAPRKVYPVDQGLSNAVAFRISPNTGYMLETAVFIQLRRNMQVWYFSGRGECDFIVKDPEGGYRPVQVCWHLDRDNTDRELFGLEEAMEFFRQDTGTIVTSDQEETMTTSSGKTVEVVPFWRWAAGQPAR
jgi:predicted AAA+ superfamily ATPase